MTTREPGAVGTRWGIGLCALAVACAVLAVVGWARFSGAHDRIGDYPSVAAGSDQTVTFDDAGGKTLFFESPCFECEGDSSDVAPNVTVTTPDGSELAVEGYATDGTASKRYAGGFFSYSRGDVEGEPVYTVTIPAPGDYRVRVGDSSELDAVLRIGPSVTGTQVTGLIAAVAGAGSCAIALLAGVAVLIVSGGRRRRWRAGGAGAPTTGSLPPPPPPPPPGTPGPPSSAGAPDAPGPSAAGS